MQKKFEEIFENANEEKVQVKVTKVGDRPCASIEKEKIEALKNIIVPIIEDAIGEKVIFNSSSTDCNIPLSLGVSALCIGTNYHAGVHTREEWVEKKSLIPGLEIAIKAGLELTK